MKIKYTMGYGTGKKTVATNYRMNGVPRAGDKVKLPKYAEPYIVRGVLWIEPSKGEPDTITVEIDIGLTP